MEHLNADSNMAIATQNLSVVRSLQERRAQCQEYAEFWQQLAKKTRQEMEAILQAQTERAAYWVAQVQLLDEQLRVEASERNPG